MIIWMLAVHTCGERPGVCGLTRGTSGSPFSGFHSQQCVTGMAQPMSLAWRSLCHWHGEAYVTGMAQPVSLAWRSLCHWHGAACVTGMAQPVSLAWRSLCHWHGAACVTGMAQPMSLAWRSLCHWHGAACVTGMAQPVSLAWRSLCHRHGAVPVSPCPVLEKKVTAFFKFKQLLPFSFVDSTTEQFTKMGMGSVEKRKLQSVVITKRNLIYAFVPRMQVHSLFFNTLSIDMLIQWCVYYGLHKNT